VQVSIEGLSGFSEHAARTNRYQNSGDSEQRNQNDDLIQ